MHKVIIDEVSVFELPLYKSLLVDEAIYWNELRNQGLTRVEQARAFVIKSLRLREVVPKEVSDSELSAKLTVSMITELWELLYYGPDGPPEFIAAEEEETEKKKPTGEKSGLNSSSITPTSKSSKKTLAAAQ